MGSIVLSSPRSSFFQSVLLSWAIGVIAFFIFQPAGTLAALGAVLVLNASCAYWQLLGSRGNGSNPAAYLVLVAAACAGCAGTLWGTGPGILVVVSNAAVLFFGFSALCAVVVSIMVLNQGVTGSGVRARTTLVISYLASAYAVWRILEG